jgi:cell shape-determining protein MreC
MNPEIIQSKTDFRKYLAAFVVIGMIFGIDILGLHSALYSKLDQILIPFVILIRNNGIYVQLVWDELMNRPFLARENLELKRQISEYEQILVENEKLKKQIEHISQKYNIISPTTPKLVAVDVFGIQDLYSLSPKVKILIPHDFTVEKWDPVYLDRVTLFGFITDVESSTAVVSPLYSKAIPFSIPVQSISNPSIKGFVSKRDTSDILIRNVPKDVDIPKGDIWVTTNDVVEVPPGLIIGKVKAVRDDVESGFKELVIVPTLDLASITMVYLRYE